MPTLTPLEAIVTCESSLEALESQLTEAVKTAPKAERSGLSHIASLVYEMIGTGNYGKGPFEITMCSGTTSLAVTVTTLRTDRED
jgi:hypothetical protein